MEDEDLGVLSDSELRERSQLLDETQELYEELAYLSVPKMPCPECSGSGGVYAGSLGGICVRCMGQRVIDRPGCDPIEQPPFAQLRAAITAYGNGVADRVLPDGHEGKRHLALPDPASVPTLDEIRTLRDEGKQRAKQLQGIDPLAGQQLAEPQEPRGLLAEEGELGDYTDAELDEIEEEEKKIIKADKK